MLLVLGTTLFVTGLFVPRYHDKEEYERRYMALDGPNRSKEFYELRRQSLTSSYRIQDYGLTVISLGILAIVALRWRQTTSILPKKKVTVGIFGIVVAFVTIAAQVGSLFLDFERGEFPHWADSLGIPLAGMPILFIFLSLWAGVHSLLVANKKSAAWRLTLRDSNWWLAFLISVTCIILVVSAATGDFWQVLPSALWMGFYFSIWISRSKEEPNKAIEPTPMLASEQASTGVAHL